MSLTAFNYGANIVAFRKVDSNYGMCCSWATQVDEDKLCLLIGEQSITGQNIEKDDIIGVSSLASHQKRIAEIFGNNHSNEINKFAYVEFNQKDNVITINGAKVKMVVKVISILKLEGIEGDKMVYAKIIQYEEDEDIQFLQM